MKKIVRLAKYIDVYGKRQTANEVFDFTTIITRLHVLLQSTHFVTGIITRLRQSEGQ